MEPDDVPAAVVRARKIGRRSVLGAFMLVVSGMTLAWTVQIIQQVWFRPASATSEHCRSKIAGLITAVRRARQEADAETGGERAAVQRFRGALRPEWDSRDALDSACHGDPLAERALRDVDRLRYAEEHATRYEAVDLAERRRGIAIMEKKLQTP